MLDKGFSKLSSKTFLLGKFLKPTNHKYSYQYQKNEAGSAIKG